MKVEEINKVYECCKDSFHRRCDECPVTDDCCHDKMPLFVLKYAISLLKEQQPKTGRWISVPHKKARICNRCESDEPYKFADDDADVYDYCPHCGAKMEKQP